MRISIVGTGYVGLVSGACLADVGHDVTCVDMDPAKVDMINSGRPTIHELGLAEILERTVGKTLRATADLDRAVRDTEVTFIAVGTPARDGRIDLGYVRAAADEIGRALKGKPGYHTVVVKSTVIPGTTDHVVRQAVEDASGRTVGAGFGLGMNPEFLTEGRAVEDFSKPDRIVIGGFDERSCQVVGGIYDCFEGAPRIFTNNTTAELIKYASNAALATAISFANEISRLCRYVRGRRCRGRDERRARVHLLHDAPARARTGRCADYEFPRGRLRLRRQLPAQGCDGPRRAGARLRARPAAAVGRARGQSRTAG
jgi:UDPglucose 6-dehydrogenase